MIIEGGAPLDEIWLLRAFADLFSISEADSLSTFEEITQSRKYYRQ